MGRAHEPHRIGASAVHKLGGLFALLLILILCVMYVLWQHVRSPTLNQAPQVLPRQPRLQANPPPDRIAQYRLQGTRLNSYGWNDGNHRTAHIPVQRAIALLVQEHGTPKRTGGVTPP